VIGAPLNNVFHNILSGLDVSAIRNIPEMQRESTFAGEYLPKSSFVTFDKSNHSLIKLKSYLPNERTVYSERAKG